jgi:heme-degrading monooxygenase HmoA
MAVIVVTRLRLRDPSFFDQFFSSAVVVVEQAKNSPGNLGADVLAEANDTYWTRTAWRDQDVMQAFVGTEPHRSTMNHIDEWCDEATFVNWEEAGGNLPDWQESYSRLLADGQVAALTSPSDAHHTRDFPAPVLPS